MTTEFSSEPMYYRDASWHNRPDTIKPKKVHRHRGDGFAVCSGRIMLNLDWPMRYNPGLPLCLRCYPESTFRPGEDE